MGGGSPNTTSNPPASDRRRTDTDVAVIIRSYNEALRRKLEMLAAGRLYEPRTARIDFRTWPELKEAYLKAPSTVKVAARRAFEAVILSWFLGSERVEYSQQPDAPQIFNVNINVNEARAEARAEAKMNAKVVLDLEELVERLERKVVELYRARTMERGAARQLLQQLGELREKLRELGVN